MPTNLLVTVDRGPDAKPEECGKCSGKLGDCLGDSEAVYCKVVRKMLPESRGPLLRHDECLAAEAAHEDLRRQTIGPELMNVLARLEKAAGYKQVTAEVYWWEQLRSALAADGTTLDELQAATPPKGY